MPRKKGANGRERTSPRACEGERASSRSRVDVAPGEHDDQVAPTRGLGHAEEHRAPARSRRCPRATRPMFRYACTIAAAICSSLTTITPATARRARANASRRDAPLEPFGQGRHAGVETDDGGPPLERRAPSRGHVALHAPDTRRGVLAVAVGLHRPGEARGEPAAAEGHQHVSGTLPRARVSSKPSDEPLPSTTSSSSYGEMNAAPVVAASSLARASASS